MKIRTAALIFALAAPTAAHAAQSSSLSLLSDAERDYYDQIFGYAMDNTTAGENYHWASYSGQGDIHVDAVFVSKSGVPCRPYSETFTVQNVGGSYHGTACKRQGADGWCRLKPTNANTCAMEDRNFMFSMPSLSTPDVHVGSVANPLAGASTPSITGPNVNTPHVDAPKGHSDGTGSDFATSVTGNAGKAAGSAAANGLSWFAKTFGR